MSSSARITDSGRKGDIRIAFGFERQNDGKTEPVMYVYAVRSPRQVASVPLSLMYLFDTREKDAGGQLVALGPAQTLAEAVYGGVPTKMEIHRVLDAVTEWMNDLKNMPPPSTIRDFKHAEELMKQHGFDLVQ